MTVTGGIEQARDIDRPQSRRDTAKVSRDADFIQAALARVIEGEILPRLTRAHPKGQVSEQGSAVRPTPDRVVALARSCMDRDPDDAQVSALMEEGLPLGTLLLDLLAPAAHQLGKLWEEDEADFVDVTVALGRLHALARTLCVHMEQPRTLPNARRILLMPCPGETHLFSLALVASFFREAGWHVVLSAYGDVDPMEAVRNERFDVIGVSLSCDVHMSAMADLVAALRSASRNPEVRVLVGGPLFMRDPACTTAVGADAAAEDARSAVRVAEALVEG